MFFLFNREWYCHQLDWHKKPREIKKGIVFESYGKCPVCEKDVHKDSDGNWSSK